MKCNFSQCFNDATVANHWGPKDKAECHSQYYCESCAIYARQLEENSGVLDSLYSKWVQLYKSARFLSVPPIEQSFLN